MVDVILSGRRFIDFVMDRLESDYPEERFVVLGHGENFYVYDSEYTWTLADRLWTSLFRRAPFSLPAFALFDRTGHDHHGWIIGDTEVYSERWLEFMDQITEEYTNLIRDDTRHKRFSVEVFEENVTITHDLSRKKKTQDPELSSEVYERIACLEPPAETSISSDILADDGELQELS